MKILVCTDGSKESKKALEEAAKLALGCSSYELDAIHVYDHNFPISGAIEDGMIEKGEFNRLMEASKRECEAILLEAEKFFAEKNIKIKTISKVGHTAHTIIHVANEGRYDMVVLGSRGLGGLKKLLLGSVSNAVIHEVKSNVLIVK